jgi:nitroreductase
MSPFVLQEKIDFTPGMEFSELLIKRRSVRHFLDKPVALDIINSILSDSTLAPSAGNEQPWKFIIVSKREMIDRISGVCKRSMLDRIASNPNDYAKKYEKMLQKESFHIFYHAPLVIYIIGDAHLKNLYVDCALAASYLMMSAASKGLGSCWVNFGTEIHDPALRDELGISDNHKIVAPIVLGYPERIPPVPGRNDPKILKLIE